ncbi:MAG: FtsX-like permease family protein [Acidimicrobiales bacterium]
MGPVWARLRADLLGRWRGWCGLVLLVGLTGTISLTAAAAARRTDTALPRLLEASRAPDVLISPQDNGLGAFDAEIARLPEVAAMGEVAGVPLARIDASGQVDPLLAAPPASIDGRAGYSIYRPKLLSGRMPRRDSESEILATKQTADRLHLKVGSRLTLAELSRDENNSQVFDPQRSRRWYTFRVVGIGLFPDALTNREPGVSDNVLFTPAWYRAHGDPTNLSFTGAFLRLHRGASVARLRQEVDEVAGRHPEAGSNIFFSTFADRYTAERRAIRPQAIALGLFAALAGATSLLVVGQAISRHVVLGAVDRPTLRALGMTGTQLFAIAALPAAGVAAAGGVLAFAFATALSPIGPIGVARLAEPHPGLSVNFGLLGLGAAAVAVLLAAWVAVPAWRSASAGDTQLRPATPDARRASSLAVAMARSGLPATVATGLRMALEPGRGRTSVPVRSALAGGALAVAALVTASSFVTDLDHLVSTPRLYGTTWDMALDAQFESFPRDKGADLLSSVRGVGSFSGGVYGNVTVGDRAIAAVGLDDMRGSVFPTLLEGRRPARTDEIVLGTNTLRRAHRSVGQAVDVQLPAGTRSMRIVGRAVFPGFGRGGFPPTDLGEGVATGAAALRTPDVPDGSYNFFLVRVAPGSSRKATMAEVGRVATAAGCPASQCPSLTPRPADVDNYSRVRSTPLLLAGVLALLAAASIGHALVTSVRRRRRDLAILKTLGFVRRQVSATVAWQATALVALALVIGMPLGLAFGRWGWALFTRELGIGNETVLPRTMLLLLVPVALAVSNLVAALPARAGSRIRPAAVLRAE